MSLVKLLIKCINVLPQNLRSSGIFIHLTTATYLYMCTHKLWENQSVASERLEKVQAENLPWQFPVRCLDSWVGKVPYKETTNLPTILAWILWQRGNPRAQSTRLQRVDMTMTKTNKIKYRMFFPRCLGLHRRVQAFCLQPEGVLLDGAGVCGVQQLWWVPVRWMS